MTLIDKIKADMEAGTKGPWRLDQTYNSIVAEYPTGWDDELNLSSYDGHMVCESVKKEENRRRIARVPEMEAALLAAEGCANWCDALIEMVQATSCEPDDPKAFDEVLLGAQQFLTTYRKTTGAA